MIEVKNTKELKERYNIKELPDIEQVIILGGLDKEKYNKDIYRKRATYTAKEVKQIIRQMEEIEKKIPPYFTDIQKAKYVYETLGSSIEYGYDYDNGNNHEKYSNLTCLLNKKAVCTGYSLLYKEMMDRLGIECEYIRGKALNYDGKVENHAWNRITIDGKVLNLDLTYDTINYGKNRNPKYFGNSPDFPAMHTQDTDEIKKEATVLTDEQVKNIDTKVLSDEEIEKSMSPEKKKEYIKRALNENFDAFKAGKNTKNPKDELRNAIKDFIDRKSSLSFKNDKGEDDFLDKYVTRDEMISIFASEYLENFDKDKKYDLQKQTFQKAVADTLNKDSEILNGPNIEQAKGAIMTYYNNEGDTCMFSKKVNRVQLTISDYDKIKDEFLDQIVECNIEKSKLKVGFTQKLKSHFQGLMDKLSKNKEKLLDLKNKEETLRLQEPKEKENDYKNITM